MLRKFVKQLKTIRKRVPMAALAAVLSLSQTLTAHAADLKPDDYVFSVVLRACGIPVSGEAGYWKEAYEGYLEAVGDRETLARLRGYSSLSWGGTAEGVDDLYWSVRNWLSQASFNDKEDFMLNLTLTLPSSPLPNGQPSSPGACGISPAPFPECGPLPEEIASGYSYSFSYMYEEDYEGAKRWVYKNVFAPQGSAVSAYYLTTSYVDSVDLLIQCCDLSTGELLPEGSLLLMGGWRYDGEEEFHSDPEPGSMPSYSYGGRLSQGRIIVGIRSLLSCPFTVFVSITDFDNWRKGGLARIVFGPNTAALYCMGAYAGLDRAMITQESFGLGPSLALPADSASARSALARLRKKLDVEALASALASAGSEVAQGTRYKVEHYTQGLLSPDGSWEWVKAGEEYFTGTSGEQAAAEPGTYENHVFAPELTQPEDLTILPDGSLVVRLYYSGSPEAVFPYTVEYYKDGQLFDSAHGTVPMFGNRTVTDCQDLCPDYYLPDPSKTPFPFTVSETDHVIRVYYVQDQSDPVAALFNGLSGAMRSACRMAGKMVVFLLLPILGAGLVVAGVKAFKDTIYKTRGKGS